MSDKEKVTPEVNEEIINEEAPVNEEGKKKKKKRKFFDLSAPVEKIELDIPEDQIWDYQIEGLAPPHVNKPYKHYKLKKFIFAFTIIIAVSISMYLSVRTVQKDTFEYAPIDSGYQFSNFSNNGFIKEVYIDFVSELEYDRNNPDVTSNFSFKKDETKPVTEIREYAFNCDNVVEVIYISDTVKEVDARSFYSCWNLQRIEVDENNPYFCDIDGVLYNKDKTELILYPIDHDRYLRLKNGYAKIGDDGLQHSLLVDDDGKEMEELWGTTNKYDEAYLKEYNKLVRTYVVPSSVKVIGQLALAYANVTDLYLPEGLERIETMANFKNTVLLNVFSYKTDKVIEEQSYKGIEMFTEQYNSLPNGLKYIGSDAFSYDRGLTYLFIPNSVEHIGHHAYWDTVYKDGKELKGIAVINYEGSEDDYHDIEHGNQWRPEYDYLLFKKAVDINYNAVRE